MSARGHRRGRRERGAVAVTAVLGLLVLLGIGALAVDLGMVVAARTQLGTAADAAALAGAKELAFGARLAQARAVEYGALNRVLGDPVVLDPGTSNAGDVVLGFYDFGDRSFRPTGTLPNAVEVTARRAGGRGTGLPTYFAAVFGRHSLDASAQSIAVGLNRTVVVAMDVSGSMGAVIPCGHPGHPAIVPARAAAANFLEDLAASTLPERAGILAYAGGIRGQVPIAGLHDAGQPGILVGWTRALEAAPCGHEGGTNTGLALQTAIAMFQAAGPGGADLEQQMIVLLSDGLANRGRHGEDLYHHEADRRNPAWRYAVEEAADARERNITVHTISLGEEEHQVAQMQEIAEAGGGMPLVAPRPEDLDRMFETLARAVRVALVD